MNYSYLGKLSYCAKQQLHMHNHDLDCSFDPSGADGLTLTCFTDQLPLTFLMNDAEVVNGGSCFL